MRIFIIIAAGIYFALAGTAFAKNAAGPFKLDSKGACHGEKGKMVSKSNCQGPTLSMGSAPVGATAVCNDGTYSMSKSHAGSCSSHKGVKSFL